MRVTFFLILLINTCASQYHAPPTYRPQSLESPTPSTFIPIVHQTAPPTFHQQFVPSSPPGSAPLTNVYTMPYPQYFQTSAYSNINTVGNPYQIYSPRHQPTQQFVTGPFYSNQPLPPVGSSRKQPKAQVTSNIITIPSTTSLPITSPIPSYGSAVNSFLANLPPANSVYGAPLGALPPSSNSNNINISHRVPQASEDTWEALEASLDTRRSRKI